MDIDGTLVLTGYIDHYSVFLSPSDHRISISGRSKCEDLVDCSAVLTGSQLSGANGPCCMDQLFQPEKK